jgi:hypothetical protein
MVVSPSQIGDTVEIKLCIIHLDSVCSFLPIDVDIMGQITRTVSAILYEFLNILFKL